MSDRAYLAFEDDKSRTARRFCLECAEHLYEHGFVQVAEAERNDDGGLDLVFVVKPGFTMEDIRTAVQSRHPRQ